MAELVAINKLVNRIGNPNDIANLALFLASEESDFITGQVINADGGILAQNAAVPQVKIKNLSWEF
ncbi:SDR family oxidoreductase [Neobacillus rhizophilus]|uniref:SDR family oxidoreductase n=1 Tax=Neobacillus rhizophilus TaxID=2833579 RepID=UPI0027DB7A67|nr:SDR family oxidoreductase [Neobacillus rhizophilus]